jgi:radical SAM/Cys-rich protein
VFEKSIRALKLLNSMGYGATGPLELHLVCNPSGAFMAAPQEATEKRYKKELAGRFGVSFGTLMSFSNAPLGRFKDWLIRSANYEAYIKRLSRSFNPATIPGLMCRSLISVSWDGFLYDCDFNIACDSPAGGARVHVKDAKVPLPGSPIAVGNHCYACAAGAGFT